MALWELDLKKKKMEKHIWKGVYLSLIHIFIDEELCFISLTSNGGKNGYLFRSEDGGYTFEEIKYNELARNANSAINEEIEYFDCPEKIYEKDGVLYMEAGQGADGDYKGNRKGIYMSRDTGKGWEFVKISNASSDGNQ